MIELAFLASLALRDCPPLDQATNTLPACEVKREPYPIFAECEAAIRAAEASGSWEQAAADLGKYKDHALTFKCEGDETLTFTVQ